MIENCESIYFMNKVSLYLWFWSSLLLTNVFQDYLGISGTQFYVHKDNHFKPAVCDGHHMVRCYIGSGKLQFIRGTDEDVNTLLNRNVV